MNKVSSYRITNLIEEGAKRLKRSNINSASLDSRILLSYVASYNVEKLLLQANEQLSSEIVIKFFKLIKRRQNNEPIAYIIGKREFYSFDFLVSKNVLIPRPDSEILIDLARSYFKSGVEENISILDLGTGSGCLLLTLLGIFSYSVGVGIDISKEAVQTARKNAVQLNLDKRVDFLQSDWSELKLKNKFDLIISNPPYIKSKDIVLLQKDVKDYEPKIALDGGEDGLDCYKNIFLVVGNYLKKNGICIFEIGAGQFHSVKKIASHYKFQLQDFKKDLSGNIRALSFIYGD